MKRSILTLIALCVSTAVFCLEKPNPSLTPGSAFKGVVERVVCGKGYSKHVRKVSVKTKKAVFREYGIPWKDRRNYEVDHLIPLNIGGDNSLSNLWPQPLPEARAKDKVEDYLHHAVCRGEISLTEAQREILNWEKFSR